MTPLEITVRGQARSRYPAERATVSLSADVEGTDPRDKDVKMTRPHDVNAPFSALVFKVVSDQHGDLTYMRIYSGKLAKGTRILNPGNGKRENASRIFEMHAQNRIPLDEVAAGNIVAVVGIKDSSGDAANLKSILDAFPGFGTFAGSEAGLLACLRGGGVGCITATGNIALGIVSKTASYTVTANDGVIECDATSAAITLTLPAVASATPGATYTLKKTDSSANAVMFDGNASETIDGATTLSKETKE